MISRLSTASAVSFSFVAAAFAPACSSPADRVGQGEGALVINPVASEHESHLTIQLPTDACQPGATCAKVLGSSVTVYLDGNAVALGASTRLKPGSHTVAVNNVGGTVTTFADQSSTLVLPVVDRKCVDAALPNVPKTDFGTPISVSNAACPTTAQGSSAGVPQLVLPWLFDTTPYCQYVATQTASTFDCSLATSYYPYSYRTTAGACVLAGYGVAGCLAAQAVAGAIPGVAQITDTYAAFPPGTLSATVNGSPQSVTLASGDEVDFSLSLPALGTVPPTFQTTLTFLDPRANPDAAKGTITSSCASDSTYTIPSATGTPAPLALNAFVNTACVYTLNVSGRSQTLSQSAPNDISLHRLDVDDVTITREDGSTYTTKGTYTLNYGGVQVAGPYSTSTGIDVLSGTYQFSLTFTDFDGVQTQTQTITL